MKHKDSICWLAFFFCLTGMALAQNEPMYSQYMFNTLPLNPAYAGSQENLVITSIARKQWLDMDGAPSTQTLSAHSPVRNKNIALGLTAFHDKIGVTSRTGLYGVYAYRISFSNNSKLSLGLQAGLINMVQKFSQLQTKQQNDPRMSADRTIFTAPGVGTGVYWYSSRYFLGASVPDLMELHLNRDSRNMVHYLHYFLHGGYVFTLSPQLKYMPVFLIKGIVKGAPQYDLNNVLIINDVLWLGLCYRSNTSLNLLVQAQVTNQLTIGYAYDSPISRFSSLAGASHEVRLSYKLVFFKDNAFMPRYF